MPTTATYALRYPLDTDRVADTALRLRQLAEDVEAMETAGRARGPQGLVLYKRTAADQGGITTPHTYLAQDFAPVAGRAYAVSTGALVSTTVAGDDCSLHLKWGAQVVAGEFSSNHLRYNGATSGFWIERRAIVRPTAATAVSVSGVVARIIGTGTLIVSASQTYLAVEDLGVSA